jgi:hypothetical protein
MKKGVLYILLFVYTLGVIKPTLPFVYDAVSHAFFYTQHVATVHKANGKQHVHHEFIKEAKKENSGNNDANEKKIIPTDEHISAPFFHKPPITNFGEKNFCPVIINCTGTSLSGNYPPPKKPFI